MRRKIEAKLRQMRWSPEQISGWLCEQGIKLSHERIYQMIWQDKHDGGDLWRSLRRRGKRYNKRAGKNAGRGLIPNKIDISERPAIVARKTVWETGRAILLSAPDTKAACSRWSSAKPTGKIIKLPCTTASAAQKSSRASPQAYRRLRAYYHLRQRKGVRCASGHRPCLEGQNLLRHAVSRMGARLE